MSIFWLSAAMLALGVLLATIARRVGWWLGGLGQEDKPKRGQHE